MVLTFFFSNCYKISSNFYVVQRADKNVCNAVCKQIKCVCEITNADFTICAYFSDSREIPKALRLLSSQTNRQCKIEC